MAVDAQSWMDGCGGDPTMFTRRPHRWRGRRTDCRRIHPLFRRRCHLLVGSFPIRSVHRPDNLDSDLPTTGLQLLLAYTPSLLVPAQSRAPFGVWALSPLLFKLHEPSCDVLCLIFIARSISQIKCVGLRFIKRLKTRTVI